MLALSNTYFLQSHTELTSYSTVRQSHIQAFVPRVLPYPCTPEHAQFAPNITPAACYPCTIPHPQHTATVFMNFSGSRQNSATRSQLYFENDSGYKTLTSTSHGCLSQSRNLPKSNYTLHNLPNPEHQSNLKSVRNIASRKNRNRCSNEGKATFHRMAKLKPSTRTPFHDRLSSSFHIQDNDSCISFEEQEHTQLLAQQIIQDLHVEDTSCQEEHQEFTNAQRVSSTCRKLNHSIASILNISSGHTDNQMYTPGKSQQETDNTSNNNDSLKECSQTSDILINEDTVVSEQHGYFEDDLGPASKHYDDSFTLQSSTKREYNEFRESGNTESMFKSTNSARCDSFPAGNEYNNVGDIDVVTINTAKHNNPEVPQMNTFTMKTKAQEMPVVQDTNLLPDANKALDNIRNNKYPWTHLTKQLEPTSENLQVNTQPSSCSQMPFLSTTTSPAMLPPFYTLSPLHRRGAYDKASAFKPISKLPVSTHQFPDYVVPYENWTCRSFLPQNIRASSVNRQANPATLYGSSGIYPKCINEFSNVNNTFDESGAGRQSGLFYQRQGIPNIPNSSVATPANEIDPDNLERWMTWLRQTEAHATKSSQFDERISSRVAPPPRYHCDFCNKTYSTFGGLSKHRQFHCSQHVKKEFSCKLCNRAYSSLGALKMHIRTHTLPCKCQECGKAFSRPWLLQGHLRTHTGEKPFKCSHCGRAFADRSNLRAHLQTHAEIKRYACSKCGKTFSRMSLLTKHTQGSCLANIKRR